jgi:hypothetical protein
VKFSMNLTFLMIQTVSNVWTCSFVNIKVLTFTFVNQNKTKSLTYQHVFHGFHTRNDLANCIYRFDLLGKHSRGDCNVHASLLIICVKIKNIWYLNGYQSTMVRLPNGAGNFRCNWSWNAQYGHSHCTSALACTEVISSLRSKGTSTTVYIK